MTNKEQRLFDENLELAIQIGKLKMEIESLKNRIDNTKKLEGQIEILEKIIDKLIQEIKKG